MSLSLETGCGFVNDAKGCGFGGECVFIRKVQEGMACSSQVVEEMARRRATEKVDVVDVCECFI